MGNVSSIGSSVHGGASGEFSTKSRLLNRNILLDPVRSADPKRVALFGDDDDDPSTSDPLGSYSVRFCCCCTAPSSSSPSRSDLSTSVERRRESFTTLYGGPISNIWSCGSTAPARRRRMLATLNIGSVVTIAMRESSSAASNVGRQPKRRAKSRFIREGRT